MPLIQCPDCGKDVSDAAPACIHCGRPTAPKKKTQPIKRLPRATKLYRAMATMFTSLAVIAADATEFPLREDFSFKIPFLRIERNVYWKAEPGRCAVYIRYGSSNTIPTFPNAPSDQVWILTADGKTIPMAGHSIFVGATTGLGPLSYSHIRTFDSEAVTNAVAVVVKISTNLVVQSVLR